MIIFALLLVLFAAVAFAGYSFGVIRATTTFIGLLISIIVARMFHHSLASMLGHLGVKNPLYVWLFAPVLPFVLSLLVFKIIGFTAQRKLDHYYKYKAGDLRMGLWNRLNPRLGLCVGVLNATIYMVLISMSVYILSYPTVQLVAGNGDYWAVKLLNEAGRELQSCGLTKVAAAIDPLPATYYQAADLAGLIYHNDLLEARLGRYPAFISLGEMEEFKQIAADKDFTELRQKQPPFMDIVNHPKMTPISRNPDLLASLWQIIMPDMQDLEAFLQSGQSQKYGDNKLLGRWDLNLPVTFSGFLESKPNYTPTEMRKARIEMLLMFTNTTTLTASLKNEVFVKNLGSIIYVTNTTTITPGQRGASNGRTEAEAAGLAALGAAGNPQVFGLGRGGGGGGGFGGPGAAPAPARAPAPAPAPAQPIVRKTVTPTVKMENLQGTWRGEGSNFQINLARRNLSATVAGERLTVSGSTYTMVFDRE